MNLSCKILLLHQASQFVPDLSKENEVVEIIFLQCYTTLDKKINHATVEIEKVTFTIYHELRVLSWSKFISRLKYKVKRIHQTAEDFMQNKTTKCHIFQQADSIPS